MKEMSQLVCLENMRVQTTNANVKRATGMLQLALLAVITKKITDEIVPPTTPSPLPACNMTPEEKSDFELTPAEVAVLEKGKEKIKCVKMVLQRTGLGLKDSKTLVERYMQKNYGYTYWPGRH